MSEQDRVASCPTCGKNVDWHRRQGNPSFPFCSERCKLIDLGKWLNEEHRIVEPATGALQDAEREGHGGEQH